MMQAVLLAASMSTFAVSPFQRVLAVTQPCSIRRLGETRWLPLPSRPAVRVLWDLFPGDHVICTGRGKVSVFSGKSAHSYTDYVALTAPTGLLGGRANGLLPGAIGLGGASRALTHVRPGSAFAPAGLADPSEMAKLEAGANRAAAGLSEAGAGKLAAGMPEAAAAKAASGIEAFRGGDIAIVAAIGAVMVWLFSAKQWLWLTVAAVVLVAFVVSRKH